MSDYTKTTDFAAKDSLATGDPNKRANGTEVDTEFNNIATAVATKANKVSSPVANDILKMTASGDLTGTGFAMDNVTGDINASHTEINEVCDASEGSTSNFQKLRFGYVVDNNTMPTTVLDIATHATEDTWTSIAPVIADIGWVALQALPSTAKAIKVKIRGTANEDASGDQATLQLFVRDYGSSDSTGTDNNVFVINAAANTAVDGCNEATIILDGSQRFELYWSGGAGDTSHALLMYLVGWYE